jgi:hypothetical protein
MSPVPTRQKKKKTSAKKNLGVLLFCTSKVLEKYEYLPHRHADELRRLKRFYCGNHWIQMLARGPVRRRRTQHLRFFFEEKF